MENTYQCISNTKKGDKVIHDATMLGTQEYEEFLQMNDMEKENFISALGLIEWQGNQRKETIQEKIQIIQEELRQKS